MELSLNSAREASLKKTFLSVGGIVLLGLIFILINGISRNVFRSTFLDLSEEGLYSLSDGTKNILRSIKEPITLNFYYSKTDSAPFPAIRLYGSRVSDILQQYERLGSGKIIVNRYDPRPDSEEEDWAQKYGLQPVQLRGGEQLFIGLVGVNSQGDEMTIPVFGMVFNPAQQQFLEYDISRLISSLNNPTKPVVGILSSIDVKGSPANPFQPQGPQGWFFTSQLAEQADVRYLAKDAKEIESAIQLLVVIHPKSLSDELLFSIDQFVMRGGKLLVFVDPFAEADKPSEPEGANSMSKPDRSSNLNSLLKKWGVEQQEKKVVVDRTLATPVSMGQMQEVRSFSPWLSLRRKGADDEANIHKDDVITSRLENVLLAWPGSLSVQKVEGVTADVLLKSTKDAMLIDSDDYRLTGDPDSLNRGYLPSGQEQILAVRIRGKLKSNYPEGKPGASGENKDAPMSVRGNHLIETKEDGNVIVVADTDLLADRYSVSVQNFLGAKLVNRLNDNQGLFENAVENLSGSNDLIAIRSRGKFTREFSTVKQMQHAAETKWQEKETVLQAKLNQANARLNELLNAGKSEQSSGQQIVDKAVQQEIKQFREQRKEAQQDLRDIRRRLREDVEKLGGKLFFLNTFLIPLLLILASLWRWQRNLKRRET